MSLDIRVSSGGERFERCFMSSGSVDESLVVEKVLQLGFGFVLGMPIVRHC